MHIQVLFAWESQKGTIWLFALTESQVAIKVRDRGILRQIPGSSLMPQPLEIAVTISFSFYKT